MAELVISLKQLKGHKSNLTYFVTFVENKQQLRQNRDIKLRLLQSDRQSALTFEANDGEKTLGQIQASITELKQGKWLQISEQIQLFVSTKVLVKRQRSASPKKRARGDKCPFLEKLAKGFDEDSNVYQAVKDQRGGDPNFQQTVRITLEPDSPTMKRVPVKIPEVDELNYTNVQQLDARALKVVIVRLCEKIQLYSGRSAIIGNVRQQLYNKGQDRFELQQKCQEETVKMEQEIDKKLEAYNQANLNRNEVLEQLYEQKKETTEVEHELNTVQAELGALERENLMLNLKQLRLQDSKDMITETNELKENIQQNSQGVQAEYQKEQKRINNVVDDLKQNNNRLKNELQDAQEEVKELTDTNENLKKQIDQLKFGIARDTFLTHKIKEAVQHINMHQENRITVQNNLEQLANEANQKAEAAKRKFLELLEQKEDLITKVSNFIKSLAEKDESLLNLKIKVQEQTITIATLEQLCCIREDLNQMCEELTKLKDFHRDVQHTIYESLNHASDYILKEGLRTCQESKLIDGMIDDIEDKDEELDNLKVLLGVAERRPLRYQAIADDPIDLAMADYINNRKQRLLVPITREDVGIYLFGSRRILVKLEQGRLRVRIGGGHTSIEDFISVYAPQEIEKQGTVVREESPVKRTVFTSFSEAEFKTFSHNFAQVFGLDKMLKLGS